MGAWEWNICALRGREELREVTSLGPSLETKEWEGCPWLTDEVVYEASARSPLVAVTISGRCGDSGSVGSIAAALESVSEVISESSRLANFSCTVGGRLRGTKEVGEKGWG